MELLLSKMMYDVSKLSLPSTWPAILHSRYSVDSTAMTGRSARGSSTRPHVGSYVDLRRSIINIMALVKAFILEHLMLAYSCLCNWYS